MDTTKGFGRKMVILSQVRETFHLDVVKPTSAIELFGMIVNGPEK
jgi:hypothetical protein